MAESVDNLVLEQLRLIREKLGAMDEKFKEFNEKIDDLKVGQQGMTGVLMAFGGYLRDIDVRVEHLEAAIGAKT